MKRTDAEYHVGNLFQSGNPLTGQRGTRLDHTFLNAVQEELANAIEGSGFALDPSDNGQLWKAIGANTRFYATIAAAGAVNGAATLPGNVEIIRVGGHTVEGVGGAHYRRVDAEPGHAGKFADASGQWWQLHAFKYTIDMFGAKGDGATDSTTAIQAALDAVAAGLFRTVYIPEGHYIVSASLRAYGKINIVGDGGEASLIEGNFTGSVLQIGEKNGNNRTSRCFFRNFKVKAGPLCPRGIEWNNLQRCNVDDVRVEGDVNCHPSFAAHRMGGEMYTNTFNGLRAERNGAGLNPANGFGLHMGNERVGFNSLYARCNANTFYGFHSSNLGIGIHLNGDASGSIFHNPTTEGGSGYGIRVLGGFNNTFYDHWNENFSAEAFLFGQATIAEHTGGTVPQDGTRNSYINGMQQGIGFSIDHQKSATIKNVRTNADTTIGSNCTYCKVSIQQVAGTFTDNGVATWLERRYANGFKEIRLNTGAGTGARIAAESGNVILENTTSGESFIMPGLAGGRFTVSTAFLPANDNTIPLGYPNARWSTLYAGQGTINTSDAREKQVTDTEDEEILALAQAIATVPIHAFQWLDSIARKGEDARVHIGAYAQEVETAIRAAGLDPARYALWCRDDFFEDEPDEDGNPVPLIDPETGEQAYRLGLRHDQTIALSLVALKMADARRAAENEEMRDTLEAMKARIEALEDAS